MGQCFGMMFQLVDDYKDIKEEDLRWVTDRIHYYLLRLLEDADYDSSEEELSWVAEEVESC